MTVFTGHDRSFIVEGHLIVVFDGCELFVGDLQGAFREVIDLVHTIKGEKLVCLLIENSRSDFATLINQFYGERLPFPSGVAPGTDLTFAGDMSTNSPLGLVRGEAGDGCHFGPCSPRAAHLAGTASFSQRL